MAAPADRPRFVILLATYDGAPFLREQLASLVAQEHRDWRLVWRDDGSSDETVAIVQEFAAARPAGQVERLAAPEGRVGSAASFMALLRHAAATMGPGDLVAFADQDDVWLPFKLSRAADALAAVDPSRPAIYSARQVLVDAQLNRLGVSPELLVPPAFPAALTQNLATGCTAAMNRAAALLVAGSVAPPGCQHDWWAYLLVTAAGGAFLSDAEPVVLYRQHAGNAVGAPWTFARRGWAAVRRGPGVFMGLMRQNVAALDAQRHLLTPDSCAQLDRIKAALAGGMLRRARVLQLPGLRRQTWAEQMLFRLWFMVG
jgi:glycosyltransferase involved in cell wall biosynthesis